MATTYEDVVAVFESTFLERVALSDDLVFQWFKMACGEFSTQISQLYFNNEKKIFTDIGGNDIVLNQIVVNILGYTIKRFYCERQAKVEIDWVNFKIVDLYEQLKDTAYN